MNRHPSLPRAAHCLQVNPALHLLQALKSWLGLGHVFCLGVALLISACGGGGGQVGLPTGTALFTDAPGSVTLAIGAKVNYNVGGGTPTYSVASSNRDVATASLTGT